MNREEKESLQDALNDPEFHDGLLGKIDYEDRPTSLDDGQSMLRKLLKYTPEVEVSAPVQTVVGAHLIRADRFYDNNETVYQFEVLDRSSLNPIAKITYSEKDHKVMFNQEECLIFDHEKALSRVAPEYFMTALSYVKELLPVLEKD